MRFSVFVFLLFSAIFIIAQPTQTIKGKVFDMDSKSPLIGATITIADSTLGIGAYSDDNGEFRLEGVPVGRQSVIVNYLGYEDYFAEELIITAGKEVELNIGMKEKIQKSDEVIIVAEKKSTTAKPVNEFTTVSTRSFSVEQVQRYPATLFDPSRTVLSSPGVQQSRDYQNDIIIRGNAPMGLTWRLEGIDIANPNHFSRIGGSGGSISVFSISLMGESDFSAGAFAPEYGNATSGVFDMHFRKGNNEKREFTARVGVIGVDFATEGPIQKGKSSYLVNYRYSTLGLLTKVGFRVGAVNSASTFQDLSFNVNTKVGKNGNFSIFGVGGTSLVTVTPVADTTKWKTYNDYFTSYYKTKTGATGFTYTHLLDEKSYIRVVGVATANDIYSTEDTLSTSRAKAFVSYDKALVGRYATTISYNRKMSVRTSIKAGVFVSDLFYNIQSDTVNTVTQKRYNLNLSKGNTWLLQAYAQMRYRASEKLFFTGGLHSMYFLLNNKFAIEPRLAGSYTLNDKHSFSFGYGLHSQIIPIGTYFATIRDNDDNTIRDAAGNPLLPNKDLDLMRAHHIVAGYNFNFLQAFRIKLETYYQYLFNVPVAADGSQYTILNDRFGYGRTALVSKGKGRNYGADVTIERFFAKRMFMLVGISAFRSQYQPLDKKWYSTRYDNRFSTSYMFGKEFLLKNGSAFEAGTRIVYTGGLHYTPADSVRSAQEGRLVQDQSLTNTLHLKNYFRIDARVAYRWSMKKASSSISLDIQNLSNQTNPTEYFWDNTNKKFDYRLGTGFVGIVTWMIDF